MKKLTILMSFIIICFSGISQNRATFLKETFNGTTLPAGWTIGSNASNWSISNTNFAGGEPRELKLYYNPSFNGKSRVISPVINTTGATELVVEFLHCLDNYSGSHTIGIETTSDGGATWNTGWQNNYSGNNVWHVMQLLTTSDVGSATFQFCLFYQGYSYNINNWYFDDFELYSQENLDAAVSSINNPTYSATHKADFTVFNKGLATINSVEVEYQFGDLPSVVETFTSLNMATMTSKTLSFTEETLCEPGSHVLKVNILKVNGVVDDNTENNSLQKTVNVGMTEGYRRVCIEHFTSSSCGPCVSVNIQMKNLLQNNPDKFSITKYQMNWPGVGDPYYTAEGGVRRTYYAVNAVPEIFYNGKDLAQTVNQNVFNTALEEPAVIDIAGNFNVTGTTVTVNFDVTAYLSIPSARVYAIVNEKKTTGNIGPNGELEFFHVMMKMLPDAQGTTTSFNSGEIKPFTFTQNMAGTNVEEMSDLEVHVFVQEYSSKYMFNGNFLAEYTNTQLNPPGNLALQDNGDGTITATWNAPITGTPTGYNVYLNNELIQTNHSGASYTATLTKFGYQAFKVNAVYAEGVSVPVADYIMICPDSESPTNLNAEQSEKDIILTWTAPDGVTDSYIVYFDGNVLESGVTTTTYTHTKAPSGEHTYGVSAVINGCGESEPTETNITVISCSDIPESLAAVQEGANVILTWVEPEDGVDYYNVYFDETLYQENITGTTFTLAQVPVGEHVFGLTSVTNDCESDMVTVTLEVTDDDTCDPPTELNAVQEDADVVLTWTAPADEVDSYNIYLDGTLHQDNISGTTYTVVDAPEGPHLYGVTAIVGECESEIVEKELTITGIPEQEVAFRIFPNPAEDYLKIEGNDMREILLYNILGQVIENVTVNDNHCRIETSKLNSGIYFIKIYSADNQVYTRKIVIQ